MRMVRPGASGCMRLEREKGLDWYPNWTAEIRHSWLVLQGQSGGRGKSQSEKSTAPIAAQLTFRY